MTIYHYPLKEISVQHTVEPGEGEFTEQTHAMTDTGHRF